jgi:hypothetical protein
LCSTSCRWDSESSALSEADPNELDAGAGDGLPIGDDAQDFERRIAQTDRPVAAEIPLD